MGGSELIGLLGILVGLGVLIWFAFKGWSVLLLAPIAAVVASFFSREPLLAHWTQTFMRSGAGFFAQFFPLFLLGALFGKLMEDSGSVTAIADFMTRKLGAGRVILAVVLGGAIVTYGGVSLFVAFFVIAPMAQNLFRAAGVPRRLMPAAIMLGTATFTMSAMPGTPSIQNTIPMPFFGTTPFAAPGLGILASAIMLAFGLWWLQRQESAARTKGEGFGDGAVKTVEALAGDETLRERATTAREFDPAEIAHGSVAPEGPSFAVAAAPIAVVILANLVLSLIVLPRLDLSFLARPEWGGTTPAAVTGVWAVITALTCAILTVLALNWRRIPDLRATMDAGVNASALPVINVSSLVGFGAVVAALPAFAMVRDAVLGIGGGPLVSLAVATNILAALTGSASGGLTIALDALGATFLQRAAQIGMDPALLHRVAVISSGTLDSLPHNGAVVTLLSVCGSSHREAYMDLFVVAIVGALVALAVVVLLGSLAGSF
jgi:H+/gluconate symporter-like permease